MIPLKVDVKLGEVDLDDSTTEPLAILEVAMCGAALADAVKAGDPIAAAKLVMQWLLDNADAASPRKIGGPYADVLVLSGPEDGPTQ